MPIPETAFTDPSSEPADVSIHPTAEVSERAEIGSGSRVWAQAQVREGARIGRHCILGKGVYVDSGVRIGDYCKLENNVCVYHGFTVEDGVFLGPGVMLLNDKNPRATNPDGTLKLEADWIVSKGWVRRGAAIGGGAILLPGVTVGRSALVGSGSVVTRSVPDHGLVYGNPARLHGFVCQCGHKVSTGTAQRDAAQLTCAACGNEIRPTVPHSP